MTCHAHGWKNLFPFTWDEKNNNLLYSMIANDDSIDIIVEQEKDKVIATIISHSILDSSTRRYVRSSIARTIDILTDTSPLLRIAAAVDMNLAELVKSGAGRLLRSPTLWEDAAKTLFTTNCSWSLTRKMVEMSCQKLSSCATPRGRYPFPLPESVVQRTEYEIRRLLPVGYRATYLRQLAKAFSSEGQLHSVDLSGLTYDRAYNLIGALKGFGKYATNHMMVLLGFYRDIPVDSEVTAYLKSVYKASNIGVFIDHKYGAWRDYKWWGLKLDKMNRKRNWLGD